MSMKDFKPKWAHGACRGNPKFISSNKLLIPSSFFIKSCDIPKTYLRYHFEPGIRIGCFAALPELGIIAISEKKENGPVHILSYPKMTKIQTLELNNNEQYSALHFVGLELLLTLQIKNCYEIDLWKWQSGERVYFLSIPIQESEVPDVSFSCNPLWWYQVLFQSNARFILLEVKISDDRYILDATSYFFTMDNENKIDLTVRYDGNNRKDNHSDVISPMVKTVTLQSVCWFPENNILAATSSGIFKVDYGALKIHILEHSKEKISSMTLCKSGLYIGYKTGFIDVVSLVGCRWHLIETINIEQPIQHLFTSPDYNFLVILTVKGSILYRDMNNGIANFKELFVSEFGGEIGVGFIGPFAHVCATSRKNGCVKIFRTTDGRLLSAFQIGEEIVSMATSPLCSCIVIGTSGGFVYFVDVTDIRKPKIVHCERPFDTPVSFLKFDNFGRFLVSSAHNQAVKIWNGLPSSSFAFLGSKRIASEVKDIIAFSRTKDDDTCVLILSEHGTASNKETGNVLIRLKLPFDFGKDPKKYQIDVFGTLSGDALSYQRRRFDKLVCKMTAHSSLGIVFHCPASQKVQSYPIWSDFTNQKPEDIITIKNANYICVSPNQLWIAVTDLYGSIHTYSCKELALAASSEKYSSSENMCKSFLDFPSSSNHLICCRENGVLVSYEWKEDFSFLQKIPEWILYCCLKSEEENNCLRSMEEEERLFVTSDDREMENKSLANVCEIYQKLEVWVHVINFKLDEFPGGNDVKKERSPSTFVFNTDLLDKLATENRNKLLLLLPGQDEKNVEKDEKNSPKDRVVKVLSSLSLGLITQNYSEESVDAILLEKLNHLSDRKTNLRSLSTLSFNKCLKMRRKQETLESVKDLIHYIYNLKTEFNKDFQSLYSEKSKFSNRFDNAQAEARRIAQSLPSKAERDFWNAICDRDTGTLYENVEYEDIENQSQTPDKDTVKESKDSIDSLLKSSQKTQEDFDSRVEILLFKKRFTDYKIFISAVKIRSLLILTEVEDNFSKFKQEAEADIKYLEGLRSDIDGLTKAISDIEKSIKHASVQIMKKERNSSFKIGTKYQMLGNEGVTELLRQQPALKLDSHSQNPFWRSSPSIKENDVESITKEFQIQRSCPENVQKSEWEKLCNRKIRISKFGVIMRNFKDQAIIISNKKEFCAEADSKLVTINTALQKVIKDSSLLISKFRMSFGSLIGTELVSKEFLIVDDSKRKVELESLSLIPASDHYIWQDISDETYRVQKILLVLEEIEQHFRHLYDLQSEMRLKIANIRDEITDSVRELVQKLDDCKLKFSETKSVADDVLENGKKNVFKILKSRILNEAASQGKIGECK